LQELIQNLRHARQSHKRWVGYASALIEGIPVDKGQVPVNFTDCQFGKWYYNEGQKLSSLPEFRDIEKTHEQLHIVYMQIFKLLFVEQKTSLFSKLIGKAAKINEQNKKEARDLFKSLDKSSNLIVEKLRELEQKLKSMPAEELDSL